MKIERPLMPGFLKRAEQRLLLSKPAIWSTRVHLVLYYGFLVIAALVVLALLDPVDLRERSASGAWTGFVTIISVIGLTVWLIYLLRFNVFKKYGNIHPLYTLVSFLLYFVCAAVIVSFTYIHAGVESIRANVAYGDEEVVQDINAINSKVLQLEFDKLRVSWDYDSVALVKYLYPVNEDYAEVMPDSKHRIPFTRLDSNSFFHRLEAADSAVKVNDTLYLVYDTPDYMLLSVYEADTYTKGKVNSAFELYHFAKAHRPGPAERATISKELLALIQKYDLPYRRTVQPYEPEPENAFKKVERTYRLGSVDQSLENLVDKKYRWRGDDLEVFIRVIYYVALGLALLILVFRHTTTRTFFLTLLSGLLLTLLTAFIGSFARLGDLGMLALLATYILLFFIGSLAVWRSKKRHALTGIFLNLSVPGIVLLPVLLLAMYDKWRYNQYIAELEENPYHVEYWMIVAAEATGSLMLLILLATYYYKTYRRWYALPEH